MSTLKSFIHREHIRISSEWAASNPNMEPDAPRQMNHFKCTLRRAGKQYTFPFSMGIGLSGEPQAEDVLDCLASDAAGVENARGFEDWASEYGYDTDSRRAERIFNACKKQAERLLRFLGYDLYQELLWKVER